MGITNLGERCTAAAAMRDEYERNGGFVPGPWEEDSARYRSDVTDPKARAMILAMQAVYQREFNFSEVVIGGEGDLEIRRLVLNDILYYESDEYTKKRVKWIFNCVCDNMAAIDDVMQQRLTCDWQVERLGAVERSILRTGIAQICFKPEDADTAVRDQDIIACCSDMAGDYATERSRKLVFGVLSECVKTHRASAGAAETKSDSVPAGEGR